MAKTLDIVTLPEQAEWVEDHTYAPVAMSSRRTLGGRWHYSTRALSGGRPIVIAAGERVAWYTESQVIALQTLASAADSVYTLTWGSDTYSVVFDWEAGDPIDLRPVWPHNDNWFGNIKLREVAA